MIRRNITQRLLSALTDTPVVLLHGARQVGKTTLARSIAETGRSARYLTLDDPAVLAAVKSNPHGFVAELQGPVVLDEVQRVSELPLAIKAAVDRNRTPGRFLLTGSANILHIPRLSESLAGRMEILALFPFSQGEIEGGRDNLVDALWAAKLPEPTTSRAKNRSLVDRLVFGGYPEVQTRASENRRYDWFASYIDTILQRDVRDLSSIEGLTLLPRLLAILAARAGSLLNYADISRSLQMPQSTLKRYIALLEMTFLIQMLPPWSANLSRRLVKAPKLYLSDTGLLTHVLRADGARLDADPVQLGHVVENFVVTELRKQASWSQTRVQLFHYRTPTGREVDLVLEGPKGLIVGVEVKSSATVNPDDFKGLRYLAEAVGDRFHRGVVLYRGQEAVPFGKDLHAVPIDWLWRVQARSGQA